MQPDELRTARLLLRGLRATDIVIGWGGLGIDPLASKWEVEVSYFMHPEVAGHGYATELVRAAVNTGFDVHRFERIAAFARAENAASLRVLTKCGFTFLRFEPELDRNRYELTRNQRRESQP